MNQIEEKIAKEHIKKSKKKKEKYLEPIDLSNIINEKISFENLFSTNQIKVNFRTGTKIYLYCTICSVENSRTNSIEIYHIRHIKKGEINSFSQIKCLYKK